MRWRLLLLAGVALAALVQLAGCTRQQVYENLYQGLHTRERLVHPPPPGEAPPAAPMPYYDYEKARQETGEDSGQGGGG